MIVVLNIKKQLNSTRFTQINDRRKGWESNTTYSFEKGSKKIPVT
jgi:hypothetical protein